MITILYRKLTLLFQSDTYWYIQKRHIDGLKEISFRYQKTKTERYHTVSAEYVSQPGAYVFNTYLIDLPQMKETLFELN